MLIGPFNSMVTVFVFLHDLKTACEPVVWVVQLGSGEGVCDLLVA